MEFLKKNWGTSVLLAIVIGYIAVTIGSNNCAMCVVGEMFSGSDSTKQNAEVVPAWHATDIDGKKLSSADTQGKVSIIVYWATWCAPCRKEFPILTDLRNEFDADQLEIVGVSVDMPGKDLKPFVNEHALNYTIALNNDSLEEAFGPVKYIPTLFILDAKGAIRHRHTGNVGKEVLQAQIRNLINSPSA